MSIAIPTITLIALIVPGLFFRRFYYSNEFSPEYFKSTYADLIFSATVPGLICHLIVLLVIHKWYSIDLSVFAVLFSGTSETDEIEKALRNIYRHFHIIIGCFGAEVALLSVSGFFAKYGVRKYKLDRKYKLFRFQNIWHYIFSGEILDFPGKEGNAEDIEFVLVDALVETNDGSVIYSGILYDHHLNKENGIDHIYLSGVSRRFLKEDGQKKYYQLPGEIFILPYDKIVNIHVTYYSVIIEDQKVSEAISKIETE